MSSNVKLIADAIGAKTATLAPAYTKAPYVWDVELNNTKTSKDIYRVIPGDGNSVEGTFRTITMDQKFTVFLTTNFVNKNGNDLELQGAIERGYAALELITAEAMQRRFAINSILSVSGLELISPEIDKDNHTVTIGASYSVLYRME